MRRIISSTFVSLDGVMNHLQDWHFPYIDEDLEELVNEQLLASDAMLMGRETYEGYAAVWPERDGEYADRINSLPKYVASTTLKNPEWTNTTVLEGDLIEAVRALKAQDGGDILMHGFGAVAKALLREGLLDELHLWYHPAFAGVGEVADMLFTPGLTIGLRHSETRTLKSGVVVLSYQALS